MRKEFMVIGPGNWTMGEENFLYGQPQKLGTRHGVLLYYLRYRGEKSEVLVVGYLVDSSAELTPGSTITVNAIESQQEEAFVRGELDSIARGSAIIFFE